MVWFDLIGFTIPGLQRLKIGTFNGFLFTFKFWIKSICNLIVTNTCISADSSISLGCKWWNVWHGGHGVSAQWRQEDRKPTRRSARKQNYKTLEIRLPHHKFPPSGFCPSLIFGRCCCHFLFHGSTLDINLVQFANHKHLVKFSLATYTISLRTQTICLCLGNTKPWLCLGTANALLKLQCKQRRREHCG